MLNVNKKYLLIISGILWGAVGIFLNLLALKWFRDVNVHYSLLLPVEGFILGLFIAFFGLRRVMLKNANRIMLLPNSSNIMRFQAGKSYFLIGIMMTMGIIIRKTGVVPQSLKIPLYFAMGTGLFLSSFGYFKKYLDLRINRISQ